MNIIERRKAFRIKGKDGRRYAEPSGYSDIWTVYPDMIALRGNAKKIAEEIKRLDSLDNAER